MDIFEMIDGSGSAEATYHWQSGWPNTTCAYPDGHEEVFGAVQLGADWADEWHEFAVERTCVASLPKPPHPPYPPNTLKLNRWWVVAGL
jgi:hypothetical protein